MVNTRVKGNKARNIVIKRMERAGYLVDTVEKTSKFAKVKDLFGLFDIFCIRKGVATLIQVTCNKPHSHKDYKEFSKTYHNNGIEIWQFVKYDRNGWRLFRYDNGGKIEYDERRKQQKNNKKDTAGYKKIRTT